MEWEEEPQIDFLKTMIPKKDRELLTAVQTPLGGRKKERDFTTLDRIHQAMLLFHAGQTSALRQLLDIERKKGRRFERLALALTALYPEKTPERRWIEGVQAMIRH